MKNYKTIQMHVLILVQKKNNIKSDVFIEKILYIFLDNQGILLAQEGKCSSLVRG